MNIKKVKPLYNTIITTMDMYTKEDIEKQEIIDGSIIEGNLKEHQTVVAIGDSVRGISVGDLVSINPRRYEVKKHQDESLRNGIIGDNIVIGYNFNTLLIDNIPHLYLDDRDINYVALEYSL